MRNLSLIPLLILSLQPVLSQIDIPPVYSGIDFNDENKMYAIFRGDTFFAFDQPELYNLEMAKGNPLGTLNGIAFDFGTAGFNGILYYGFIHYDDSDHPLPVYFRRVAKVSDGRAEIDIVSYMTGKYDMIGWQETGVGTIGYRLCNERGQFIYDGIISFTGTGPFEIAPTIVEGPFINLAGTNSGTISFQTNEALKASIVVDQRVFEDEAATADHAIEITGLSADAEYSYQIDYGGIPQEYSFRTAPEPGSGKPFTFAYASDSRSGQGGGERDVYGANHYIMKKIMALSRFYDARFMQFTGDLVDGYLTSMAEMDLQYSNWKRAVEPWARYFPVYVGMGNHESLNWMFLDKSMRTRILIDRFPFETESSEALFARHFVMPANGPDSEDGAAYDPDPQKTDFPSYKESVYYYTYDNVAMIVLNSDYLYAPTLTGFLQIGGNLHGYILDVQLKWLETTLMSLEEDEHIDHIFVTLHTPVFPNGGHVSDDMWYNGRNDYRPFINGKRLPAGIIERRDEILDLLCNRSTKVLALLTGDEHNYNRMKITNELNIYPDTYFFDKININRPVYQINNGAAGAPYYAQEPTPWSEAVRGFTTQNALVLIHVDGQQVRLEVKNPDTLETIDEAILRE